MIDLDSLEPEFRTNLIGVIRDCLAAGISLEIKTGTLTVEEQAKLWRRSRSDCEIDHAIFELEQEKCPFLAGVLRKANASVGIAVTDKMPGFTWHNFGEQVEIPAFSDGGAINTLKKVAKKHGVSLGQSFSGGVTIRKSPFESPLEVYKAQEIDKLMQEKWGM